MSDNSRCCIAHATAAATTEALMPDATPAAVSLACCAEGAAPAATVTRIGVVLVCRRVALAVATAAATIDALMPEAMSKAGMPAFLANACAIAVARTAEHMPDAMSVAALDTRLSGVGEGAHANVT